MASRFLDQFDVILFDMMNTFMFGHDRFGPDEDYFATYRALGGRVLTRDALNEIMRASCDVLLTKYEMPEHFEDFPSLAEVFGASRGVPRNEIPLLERLFAQHELGYVPDAHREFLEHVSVTHRLGVVSNICAHPDIWLPQFEASGVFRRFDILVYSSHGRHIKPSVALFNRAVSHFPASSRILFVGDSLERDMMPAHALGLATAWIAPAGSTHPAADVIVESVPELMNLVV